MLWRAARAHWDRAMGGGGGGRRTLDPFPRAAARRRCCTAVAGPPPSARPPGARTVLQQAALRGDRAVAPRQLRQAVRLPAVQRARKHGATSAPAGRRARARAAGGDGRRAGEANAPPAPLVYVEGASNNALLGALLGAL